MARAAHATYEANTPMTAWLTAGAGAGSLVCAPGPAQ